MDESHPAWVAVSECCQCSLFTRPFALKNVVMLNYSLEKVCLSLNYSLEKVYFCTQTKMQYDAEKKN